MAQKIKFNESKPDWKLELVLDDGLIIIADGYESSYFTDELPEGKYDYYARHSDEDWTEICGIKKNKGLTVNFWGTIVTDEELDFGKERELYVVKCFYIENGI